MTEKITGSFPGGPSRKDVSPQREGPIRTTRMRKMEEARADRVVRGRARARSKRLLWGILGAVALAGGAGWLLGVRDHPTQASLQAENESQQRRDVDISQEVNRTLLELWRMEDVEAGRNRR